MIKSLFYYSIIFFTFTNLYASNDLQLTEIEKQWIQNNTVSIGIEQWKPVISLNKTTNKIDGISGEILNTVIKKLNLKTKIINKDWNTLYSKFKQQEIDLLPATYFSQSKSKYGVYSKKYFTIKNTIYVKTTNNTIKGFDDLLNKTISISSRHKLKEQIKNKYKNIKIKEAYITKDAIALLLNSKVDAFIGRSIDVEEYLKANNITNIKPILQTSLTEKSLYFLTNTNKPILQTILQKGLDSLNKIKPIKKSKIITQTEAILAIQDIQAKNTIVNHQKFIKQNKNNSYLQFAIMAILIIIFLIIIINIIINRKTKNIKEMITSSNKMLNMSLTKRYIPAVSLLAIFIIFSHILISNSINSNNELAKIINVSGKQRMLSQRLVHLGQSFYENPLKKRELIATLNEIRTAHKYLLSKVITKRLHNIYFKKELDKNLQHYLMYFDLLLIKPKELYLQLSREDSNGILTQLNEVVKEYERFSNERTAISLQYEFYMMLTTLFILFIEVVYIFRPASVQIEKNTQALLRNREYEETVIESNNNAIIAIDWTAKITTYNEKAEEIFGWTKEEMIGTRNLLNIIPEKYKDLHSLAHRKYLDSGISCGAIDKTHKLEGITKDGVIFPIQISFGAKWKIEGAIVVASIVDITSLKKQEDTLLQQSKMASMGEMIGNIAHQWRQPLSAISTNASGLQMEKEYGFLTDEILDERLQDIVDKTQYLSQTIDDFRNFYKHTDEKEEFVVNKVIDSSIKIVESNYAGSGISLHYDYDRNLKILSLGFANELAQVLINILNNAKDIIAETNCVHKIVNISLAQEDDKIILKIYDSAGGVPEDILPKVFEPYFTTKHKAQGTGIGLYMSSQIITSNFDGTLTVSNKDFVVDEQTYSGACFKITIHSV